MKRRFYIPVISAFLCLGALVAMAQSVDMSPIVIWSAGTFVSESLGYRENVLRSSTGSESSAFLQSSVDASLIRFSDSGSLFMLYVFGEDTRYFDAPSVNYEQLFSGTAKLSLPVGARNETGLEANYLYQHLVFDASVDEVNLERILVRGHSAYLRPYWKHVAGLWEAQMEGAVARQEFEHTLDDYWEGEGEARLTRNYGVKSKVSVGYAPLCRRYDTRQQFDDNGSAVPGTELTYLQNEADGEWQHYWDAARSWRSMTKLGFMANRDNGSGYFDYDHFFFREQIRWKEGPWVVEGSVRLGWYRYKKQRIDGELLYRSYTLADFRCERWFGEEWNLFCAGEHEWNQSNDPLDECRSWMVKFGVGYEF